MLESLGSFVVTFLVQFLRGWLSDQRAAQALEGKGRAETAAAVNKETADAQARASEVQINAPDTDCLIDDLGNDRIRF
jgi:hypothetical protein